MFWSHGADSEWPAPETGGWGTVAHVGIVVLSHLSHMSLGVIATYELTNDFISWRISHGVETLSWLHVGGSNQFKSIVSLLILVHV